MNAYDFGRVYKNYSFFKLLRLKSFFLICRFPFLIKNLNNIYSSMTSITGPRITNNLLKLIYGDIFIGGENFKELDICLRELKREGLIGITDYAREFLTKEEELAEIDNIIKVYKDAIDSAVKISQENSIALKVSSFGNYDTMKKLNYVQNILRIVEENLVQSKNYEDLKNTLSSMKLETIPKEEDIKSLNSIYEGKMKNYDLNIFEILKNAEQNQELTTIITKIFNLTPDLLNEYKSYVLKLDSRLSEVFSHAHSKNCLIMMDAEQSYLQIFIDYLAVSYFKKMNKENCLLMTTLQCYLKKEPENIRKIFTFCRENNLSVGIKLVRGAYMNEENRISEQTRVDSPINSDINSTHENYTRSIQYIYENFTEKDKFCIATHNLDSIKLTGELYQSEETKPNIFCAQLLGIAEHTTDFSKKFNVKVAKYVPYGNFEIMIPYLIRRAEESSMIEKLNLQDQLLNNELKLRLKF